MPQLGETVTEGTITAWSVSVGDRVEVDDALFEVSTEKVDTEVPSAVAGHVRALLVDAGETVPVGSPVAVITPGPEDPFDAAEITGGMPSGETAGAVEVFGDAGAGEAPEITTSQDGAAGRDEGSPSAVEHDGDPGAAAALPISPVVARLLAEHGLDPSVIQGSGRRGRITRSDVLAAAAQRSAVPPVAPAPVAAPQEHRPVSDAVAAAHPVDVGPGDEVVDFSRAREATAEHMRRSLSTAAHALVVVEVDYQSIEAVRRSLGLSYLPFVARAVVEALREFPHLNASIDGNRLVVRRRVRLGVAVDVEQEALVVPVIHEADDLRLPALGAAIADVADRARRRRLRGPELEGGTFTVTNVGSYGTVMAVPIINQPQVGILSTDGVRMKPVAVRTGPPSGDGAGPAEWGVAVHPVGNLSLSFDHRAVDGAYAAAFLARVRDVVQERDWARES